MDMLIVPGVGSTAVTVGISLEERFNIPHITHVFPDAEPIRSTFCLKMRSPTADFPGGYPSDEEWHGYINNKDRVLLKLRQSISCLLQIVITLEIYGVKNVVGIPFGYRGFSDKNLPEMPFLKCILGERNQNAFYLIKSKKERAGQSFLENTNAKDASGNKVQYSVISVCTFNKRFDL
ncbi:unnamed protein product [Arabidopsis halleri]